MTWRRVLFTAAIASGHVASANAQFGLKCSVPTFPQDLEASNFSDDIKAAARATCAFSNKNEEIKAVFGKNGWSWDLLPKARIDIAELTALGNQAAELNFKTNDPRALGNIRNVYMRIGDQQRWLRDIEAKYTARQQKLTATTAGTQPVSDGAFVLVVFQDRISNADKTAFLDAYHVSIVDGPNADGAYRLRLGATLPQDQMGVLLDSMRSQINVVKTAFAK